MSIPAVISAQTKVKEKHAQPVKRIIVSYAPGITVRAKAEFKSILSCSQHEEQESFLDNIFPVENTTELMKLFQVVKKCHKHSSNYHNQGWKKLKFLCSLFSEIVHYIVYIKTSATNIRFLVFGVWGESLVEVSLWFQNFRLFFLIETDLKIFKVLQQIATMEWTNFIVWYFMVTMKLCKDFIKI